MTKKSSDSGAVWLWVGGGVVLATALAIAATKQGRSAVRKSYDEVRAARELLRELPEVRRRAQGRVTDRDNRRRRAKARNQIDKLRQQIAALEAA